MEELLRFLINELVEDKQSVKIVTETDGDKINFKVNVAENDMGKIIGRQGKVSKAIRTVIKAAAKDNKIYNVEICDEI
mgnify:CR=1 FL=1